MGPSVSFSISLSREKNGERERRVMKTKRFEAVLWTWRWCILGVQQQHQNKTFFFRDRMSPPQIPTGGRTIHLVEIERERGGAIPVTFLEPEMYWEKESFLFVLFT